MLNLALGGQVWGRRLVLLFVVCLLCTVGTTSMAQPVGTIVVGNDRGGPVGARAREIAHLNALAKRVELRGTICHSSCTMYLGAEHVCVSPSTTFGFHGPTRNGAALPASQFEYWTAVMARHYNPPLRDWFVNRARHRIDGVYQISGRQLIEMGYRPC